MLCPRYGWQSELSDLVRYRKLLVEERAGFVSRIQKVLEGANLKLSSVASNVIGKSVRAILEQLVAGLLRRLNGGKGGMVNTSPNLFSGALSPA